MSVFEKIGSPVLPGEQMQVLALGNALDVARLVKARKIFPQRELIEEARDALTDALQWMDEHDV